MAKKYKINVRNLKMKNKFKYLIVVAVVVFSSSANAAVKPIAFKQLPESHIKFQATQGGSVINGEFKTFSSDISFHPDNLPESKVKVTIDIGSYIVDDAEAKGTLKDVQWFNVAAFPQAIFKSKSFKFLGDKKYEAVGDLTIKGKTQPVTIEFVLNEFSHKSAYITGQVTLKRTLFDIGEKNTDSVKDDVVVSISMKCDGKK